MLMQKKNTNLNEKSALFIQVYRKEEKFKKKVINNTDIHFIKEAATGE